MLKFKPVNIVLTFEITKETEGRIEYFKGIYEYDDDVNYQDLKIYDADDLKVADSGLENEKMYAKTWEYCDSLNLESLEGGE